MNKKYTVKPIDTITLEFEDGKNVVLRFDTKSMYHLSTEFDMKEMLSNPSVTEVCSAIIYSASVEQTEDMSIEKAREITSQLSLDVIVNIIKDFEESLGVNSKEEQKKTMQEFLNKNLRK